MITRAVSDVLTFRRYFVVSVFAVCAVALAWRATDLQLTNREFLQDHGDARYLRVVDTPASRGMIVDRNGQPLAISTPIQSVWAQPRELARHQDSWPALAEIIPVEVDRNRLQRGEWFVQVTGW